MGKTKIEWTDFSWNPITGCTPISAGCKNCYAKRMSKRLAGRFGYPPVTNEWGQKIGDSFDVTFHKDRLDKPLHWRKPRKIFVCSMGDLFHEDVTFKITRLVFDVMRRASQHTFQLLTKRPENMKRAVLDYIYMRKLQTGISSPLRNVGLGVTAENQEQWTKRVEILQQIPAAFRFVSMEPLLSNVVMPANRPNFSWFANRAIHQIIVGAETGPGARLMDLGWARSIRDQCQAAGVPFFFKKDSDGNQALDGVEWHQFPEVKE